MTLPVERLAFPGRRDDHRLIEAALEDALARAGAGLARGHTLAARAVLDEALELASDEDPSWTLLFADGGSAAQLVLFLRTEDRLELVLGRGDPRALAEFCSLERDRFTAATVLEELARRFELGALRVATTARVLGLWARERLA